MSNTVAFFTPTGLGSYRFELVVNDGTHFSAPGLIEITITNANGFIQRAITLPIDSGPAGFYRLHAPVR